MTHTPAGDDTDPANAMRASIAGDWRAHIPMTVIGTGEYRRLTVECVNQSCNVTTIDGNRDAVGRNAHGRHVFKDTRRALGPFPVEFDDSGFTFIDENKAVHKVVFHRKDGALVLLYGTHRLTGDALVEYYQLPD